MSAEKGGRTVLLIGKGDLTRRRRRRWRPRARVLRLREPGEQDVREALDGGSVDSVAVVAGEDPIVLRMALMVRAVAEDVPMLLTIFDPTMASEMADQLPNTHLTSLADIVAPSLAGPCIEERFTAVTVDGGHPCGLVEEDDDVREEPIPKRRPRRLEAFASALHPVRQERGAAAVRGPRADRRVPDRAVTATIVLDQAIVDSVYGSAKTLVTVDPNPDISKGPGWYKWFTSATMAVALVFAAAFTAGLVNRVIGRRLTGVVGRRAGPRRDHVVVVGLGQVGLRLCMLLRACEIPVIGLERDEEGELLGLANRWGCRCWSAAAPTRS